MRTHIFQQGHTYLYTNSSLFIQPKQQRKVRKIQSGDGVEEEKERNRGKQNRMEENRGRVKQVFLPAGIIHKTLFSTSQCKSSPKKTMRELLFFIKYLLFQQ